MTRLLKLDPRMAQAELRKLLAEIKQVFASHLDALATLHPTGEAFATSTIEAIATLEALSAALLTERGEADDALATNTLLFEQLRAYLLVLRRRVRTIARAIEAQDPVTARGLLRDYGIQGSQRSLTRTSHAITQLEMTVLANERPEYRALLEGWGVSSAILDQAAVLRARVEPTRAALIKERSEAERAADERNKAAAIAVDQCNMLLRLVEERVAQLDLSVLLGLDPDPDAERPMRELAQTLGSVLNKYRSKLSDVRPAADSDDVPDDAPEALSLQTNASLHDAAKGDVTP